MYYLFDNFPTIDRHLLSEAMGVFDVRNSAEHRFVRRVDDTTGTVKFLVEVPGCVKDDVKVFVVPEGLRVVSKSSIVPDSASRETIVHVSDVHDASAAKASVKEGILSIEIPQREDDTKFIVVD